MATPEKPDPRPTKPAGLVGVARVSPIPTAPVTAPVAPPMAPTNSVVRTYTVRPGDSLSKIAFKVYGDATKWRALQKANQDSLRDSVNVKVGQVLVVP